MDNHISDIYIRSFRGISNLELKDIKLINILTGDNNGGKTSVLEVIQSIKNPCDFRTWRSLIRRGERISVIRGMSYYEGFYDLFDINKEEKTIEYDVCLINGQKYNVRVMAERVEEEIMEMVNKTGIGPQLGGTTTCIGVNIEWGATHIAGLPVAVTIMCHAARHKHVVL